MAVLLTPEQLCRGLLEVGRGLLENGRGLLSSLRSSTGAGAALIEALEDVAAGEGSGDQMMECAICLDQLLAENNQSSGAMRNKVMPCRHRFHGGCLERWLRVNGTCPTCRHQLPPAPQMTRAEWSEARYRWFVEVQVFRERMRAGADAAS